MFRYSYNEFHKMRITPNTRPEWCRAKGVRLQTEPPSRHPLQADSYTPRISFPLLEVLNYLERPDVGLVFEAEAHPYYANHGKPPTRGVAGDAQGGGPNDAQQTESKKEDSSAPEAGQFQATRLIITGKTYELII